MMTTNEMITYDRIVELGIATVDEINLAFNVAQTTWTELLNRIVYARTGYRTVEDYIESEDEEDWKSPLFMRRCACGHFIPPRTENQHYIIGRHFCQVKSAWHFIQKDPEIFVHFAYCNLRWMCYTIINKRKGDTYNDKQ